MVKNFYGNLLFAAKCLSVVVLVGGLADQAMGDVITWTTYDGSVLPTDADPAWGIATDVESGDGDRSGDGANLWTVTFELEQIVIGETTVARDNTQMSTFRITYQNGSLSLYDKSSDTPGIPIMNSVAPTGNFVRRNALILGDFGGGVKGSFDIDFIKWTNDGAVPLSEPITSK